MLPWACRTTAFRAADSLFPYIGKCGGENMNPTYHRLAGQPKSIWAIPEAEHIQGITARPKQYERRVVGFLDRALLRGGAAR